MHYFGGMKKIFSFIVCIMLLSSCSLFRGSQKTGCGTNGRNVGAEKLLSGDPKYSKELKAARKAKFRG